MTSGILTPLEYSPEIQSLRQGIAQGHQQLVHGVSGSQTNFFVAALQAQRTGPLLIVTASALQARKTISDLETLLPEQEIIFYPELEIMPYDILAHSKELVTQQLRALAGLVQGRDIIVVTAIAALSRCVLPPEVFRAKQLSITTGDTVELEKLAVSFTELGYERVQQVEGPGQFSIRGGIADIFPLDWDNPLRLEFFDDEVDSIRVFDAVSQRSLEKVKQIQVIPARELLITEEQWALAGQRIKSEWVQQDKKLAKLGQTAAQESLAERIAEYLDRLQEKIFFDGLEQFRGYFYQEATTLFDYLPAGTPICLEEPSRVRESSENGHRERAESWTNWLSKGLALPGQVRDFLDYPALFKQMSRFPLVGFALLPKQPGDWRPFNIINIQAKANPALRGQIKLLTEDLRRWSRNGFTAVILAETEDRCQKILESLRGQGLAALYSNQLVQELRPGKIIITKGKLQNGFELHNNKLVVLTDTEIFTTQKKARKKQETRTGGKLEAFFELNVGDFIVHVNHGIGVYEGVQKLDAAGIQKDYLLIKYAGKDKLYVPTDQVSLIQKYLGAEGHRPKLSKLGGTEWAKIKSRVKESVQAMAEDLLQLYAARQALQGHAFSPDTVWQKEFEDAFPYEETPDQIQASAEIKADMEQKKPMDRLLCGDVGYGKTEVALRAAFKAVMEGKQVAVLVPTTILAQQHYNTFRQRLADFPVAIDMLSRFRTAKAQRQTIAQLALGQIDVIIGTHRLVQDDVKFKDLGLLIVDEEQRFGVSHKERLKQLKNTVDVLTLSATPIPRTLHMSLIGARDMSLLETPPEDRFPVQTYVVEENYQVTRDAVLRELNRGGQVFYVHNRVQDIQRIAATLQEIVPEARTAVAHGQMKEDALEQVMMAFLEGEYDLLVCTTIIESGLDIPNVNTMIINNADHLGLSQLYQLRGRVGRTNRLAYAYLTYKKDKILTEVSEKRLQAIREFTEFGSGFKIAMRDMEIRGAGNILGPEQHGHILSVGFDMYCRLLEEAVQELRGKPIVEIPEPVIEIPIDAFIENNYIPDQARKMEMYRKIMLCRHEEGVAEVYEELVDRFGDPPEPVLNLLEIAKLKALCYEIGLSAVNLSGSTLAFTFIDQPKVSGEQLVQLTANFRNLSFAAAPQVQMKLAVRKMAHPQILKAAISLLTAIKQQVKPQMS